MRITNGTFYSYGNGFVNSPPVPIIDNPKDNSEWLTSDKIEFSALSSYDPDPLDEITYYWTSNISGAIGYNDWFKMQLPEGTHSITLFVDDGRGEGHNISKAVTTKIEGFYITGGHPVTPPEDRGGGISLHNASMMIRDCVIEGNSATHGGGIDCTHSSDSAIINCKITSLYIINTIIIIKITSPTTILCITAYTIRIHST